jgi:CRP-like cAMP-binding protein
VGVWAELCGVLLQKCAAFKMRPVDPGQMLKIAEKTHPVACEAGDQVATFGEKCDVIWFVAAGSLRCEVDGIECQILGAGQSIGEMSFVTVSTMVSAGMDLEEARETSTRSADVIACEHTELLELSFDDAWRVVKTVPNLFYTLKEVAELKARQRERRKSMAIPAK